LKLGDLVSQCDCFFQRPGGSKAVSCRGLVSSDGEQPHGLCFVGVDTGEPDCGVGRMLEFHVNEFIGGREVSGKESQFQPTRLDSRSIGQFQCLVEFVSGFSELVELHQCDATQVVDVGGCGRVGCLGETGERIESELCVGVLQVEPGLVELW